MNDQNRPTVKQYEDMMLASAIVIAWIKEYGKLRSWYRREPISVHLQHIQAQTIAKTKINAEFTKHSNITTNQNSTLTGAQVNNLALKLFNNIILLGLCEINEDTCRTFGIVVDTHRRVQHFKHPKSMIEALRMCQKRLYEFKSKYGLQ